MQANQEKTQAASANRPRNGQKENRAAKKGVPMNTPQNYFPL
jgi:hypothetical protein